MVSEEGVVIDLEKINVVCEWLILILAFVLYSFLGFCLYYCRFVRGFVNVAVFLYRLIEKDKVFMWINECMLRFIGLNKFCFRY